jgi:hypothetical protein
MVGDKTKHSEVTHESKISQKNETVFWTKQKTTYEYFWNAAETVFRVTFIALTIYIL